MNEIVNKCLLTGDKFMPEMYLKQPGFTYKDCGPFTESKERIQNFKETGNSRYVYRNELDKAYFQYDMVYGDFKGLARRTASDKVLRDKAFNIAKNPKHDGYQKGLASMVYNFFDKKSALLVGKSGKGSGFTSATKQNEQLTEELHEPIIRKFEKRKVHLSSKDKIWGPDPADI